MNLTQRTIRFVVKRRGTPQKPWRWKIYCAGKLALVERSLVFFECMAEGELHQEADEIGERERPREGDAAHASRARDSQREWLTGRVLRWFARIGAAVIKPIKYVFAHGDRAIELAGRWQQHPASNQRRNPSGADSRSQILHRLYPFARRARCRPRLGLA